MPMNERGEIVRTRGRRSAVGPTGTEGRLLAEKKSRFNRITLAIGVPLHAIIGYYGAEYMALEGATGAEGSTGAVVGIVASLICILVYNNFIAKSYRGHEYVISLLSVGIASVIAGLVIAGIYIALYLFASVFMIMVALIFLGSFWG